MSETWVRAGRGAVILVAVITAAISFTHIRDLAMAYGGDRLTSPLLPLGIDGAVAAMTVFMHQARGVALHLARGVLVAAVGMTVACNTAYGAAYGVTGALLWSSPAVLFVGCVEVSVLMVRRTRPVTAKPAEVKPEAAATAVTVRETAPKRVTSRPASSRHRNERLVRLLLSSPDMTEPEIADKAGCSVSTVSREKKRMREAAMSNGKVH